MGFAAGVEDAYPDDELYWEKLAEFIRRLEARNKNLSIAEKM